MAYAVRINNQDQLRFIKGEDVTWTLQFYDNLTFAPVNLTGFTVTMTMQAQDNSLIQIPCTAVDNNLGKMTVDISAAQTGAMQARSSPPHNVEFKMVKASKTSFVKLPSILVVEAPLFG